MKIYTKFFEHPVVKLLVAGMSAGWLVGKSDFYENLVVSPELNLDLDLGFVNKFVPYRIKLKTLSW